MKENCLFVLRMILPETTRFAVNKLRSSVEFTDTLAGFQRNETIGGKREKTVF